MFQADANAIVPTYLPPLKHLPREVKEKKTGPADMTPTEAHTMLVQVTDISSTLSMFLHCYAAAAVVMQHFGVLQLLYVRQRPVRCPV